MEKEVCMNCGECFIIDIQQDFGVGCKEKRRLIVLIATNYRERR